MMVPPLRLNAFRTILRGWVESSAGAETNETNRGNTYSGWIGPSSFVSNRRPDVSPAAVVWYLHEAELLQRQARQHRIVGGPVQCSDAGVASEQYAPVAIEGAVQTTLDSLLALVCPPSRRRS